MLLEEMSLQYIYIYILIPEILGSCWMSLVKDDVAQKLVFQSLPRWLWLQDLGSDRGGARFVFKDAQE